MSRLGQKVIDAMSPLVSLTALMDGLYTRAVPGEIRHFATPFAPDGWLATNGGAYPRTGQYANLFANLTIPITGKLTSGSNIITNVNTDLTSYGLVGYPIEHALIPAGATVSVVTATTIVFTGGNASGTNSNATALIFPHGNGDGSTTFNVPNYVGGFLRTWNPGGSGPDANRAWASVQADTYKNHLHPTHDPGHAHSVYDPTHTHGVNDPTHAHSVYDPSHAHGTQDYRTGSGGVGFSNFDNAGNMGDSSGTYGAGTGIGIYGSGTGISNKAAATGVAVYSTTTGVTVLTSTDGGTETRPVNHAVLTCIKY
jgi:microcystin-dependent protein